MGPPAPPAGLPRWRLFAAWNLLVFAAWLVLPFAAAGTLRWWPGWAHLAALGLGLLLHGAFVRRRAPGLAALRRTVGAGTPTWDLVWNALYWPLLASVAVCAGLDFRAHGATLPAPLWAPGALLLAFGLGLSARAMAANPFFEPTARLQRDRDQRVVEAGPYARVRHPGYAALGCWALATPLLLLSLRAFPAALATAAWIALRTAREDALLRGGLEGYAAYAARVRWRLLPGVW